MEITIDVQVLMMAGGKSNHTKCTEAERFRKKLETTEDLQIAMDKKGRIDAQYLHHLNGSPILELLKYLASKNRVRYKDSRPLRNTHKRVFLLLQENGFVSNKADDLKYVEVAMLTDCHLLVSYDTDFHNNAKVLSKLPVYPCECPAV